jgi:hypothetical protein
MGGIGNRKKRSFRDNMTVAANLQDVRAWVHEHRLRRRSGGSNYCCSIDHEFARLGLYKNLYLGHVGARRLE